MQLKKYCRIKHCAAWKLTFCGAGLLKEYEFLDARITDSGTTCICRYQSGLCRI